MATQAIAEITAGIPKQVAEAITKIAMELGTLSKTETNKFSANQYKFVPIDGYYAIVPKVADKHGLWWRTREKSVEVVNEKTLRYQFVFDIFLKTGEMLPEYSTITIFHPLQGAQTTGSATSYAEKLFMRTVFKITTGEEDVDATDPGGVSLEKGGVSGASPFPKIKKTESDGWREIADKLIAFLDICKSRDEVREYWTDNTALLEEMKNKNPSLHEEVRVAFNKRRAAFPKTEAEAKE